MGERVAPAGGRIPERSTAPHPVVSQAAAAAIAAIIDNPTPPTAGDTEAG